LHTMTKLMVSLSAKNPYDLPQRRKRLNAFVIDAQESMARDCSQSLVAEYLASVQTEHTYLKWNVTTYHFDRLLADPKADGNLDRDPLMSLAERLNDLRATDFDKLRSISSSDARKRWINFLQSISRRNKIDPFVIDPATGKYQVSKDKVREMYKLYIRGLCYDILKHPTANIMERTDKLLRTCHKDFFNQMNGERYGRYIMNDMITFDVCRELNSLNGENFVDLIKIELGKKISSNGKVWKW